MTMYKYIAFLRAINVGGRFVKMERLRELFAAMGFTNIETYIQSGNVFFEADSENSAALENIIETQLEDALGYHVSTMLRTPEEVQQTVDYKAFKSSEYHDNSTLYISFLKSVPGTAVQQKLLGLSDENNRFHIKDRELFWLMHIKASENKFNNARLERILKIAATNRNSSTVSKIAAKFPK